jgi:solute carrier family 25 S-adenosylmethionine transporter 26
MKPIVLSWQHRHTDIQDEAFSHMSAASIGEAAACLVRVPTEVIKSKLQTSSQQHAVGLFPTIRLVLQERHGGSPISFVVGGLYRGYGITLFREIPFAMIQFPLYERFKLWWRRYDEQRQHDLQQPQQPPFVLSLQAAACGSVSGGIAAAFTTPLDVIKTRLMLGQDQYGHYYRGAWDVIQRTYRQDGSKAFWRGIQPRVMWISIGGFVFFGAYEGSKTVLRDILPQEEQQES